MVDFGPTFVYALISNSVVDKDGTIFLGATTYNADFTVSNFGVAELTKHGRLNPNFGVGGETIVAFGANNNANLTNIDVQANGTIVLGGTLIDSNFNPTSFAVAELTKDGRLNPNFGTSGKTLFDFGANYSIGYIQNFVVQPNGAIVLATMVTDRTTGRNDFAVAELTEDGNLNPDFGTGGETIVDFGPGNSARLSYGIVLPDGAIVLAGQAGRDPNTAANAWAVAELSGKRRDRHHHWWENDD